MTRFDSGLIPTPTRSGKLYDLHRGKEVKLKTIFRMMGWPVDKLNLEGPVALAQRCPKPVCSN